MRRTRTVSVVPDEAGVARVLRVPRIQLRVVKGPSPKVTRDFGLTRLRVGTSEAAEFPLRDPTVSALHCEILADTTGFRVRDLGSKNGLQVAGRRVQEAWLGAKDELTLGESVIRFRQLAGDDERQLEPAANFGGLVGSSPAMRDVYAQLARVSSSDVTVLLRGESGTGKELAAEAIVSHGARREKPLVVVDCAALPSALAESELFGHEAGAFTGAKGTHLGAFERAHGGTLFLDEVGELPLELQPKLLGALERRSFLRVGGSAPIPVDVRVIAATHRDLEREVNQGQFRADLYYRLAVAEVWLPPLRSRREDLPALIAHFLSTSPDRVELGGEALRRLTEANYPGNVRELRHAVERAALGLDVPQHPQSPVAVDIQVPYRVERDRVIARFERAYVGELLASCQGNVSLAARRSGMNRVHLHEVIRRLGLK